MRHRGDRVTIINGTYDGYQGTVESNAFQATVDFPGEPAKGEHVILDRAELVTV